MIRPSVTNEMRACVLMSAFACREIGTVSAALPSPPPAGSPRLRFPSKGIPATAFRDCVPRPSLERQDRRLELIRPSVRARASSGCADASNALDMHPIRFSSVPVCVHGERPERSTAPSGGRSRGTPTQTLWRSGSHRLADWYVRSHGVVRDSTDNDVVSNRHRTHARDCPPGAPALTDRAGDSLTRA